MAFPGVPNFPVGLNLQSGDQLNAFVHNTLSVDINVRAHAGGGQQFATLIDAVVNVVTRVTNAGDSVQLPPTNGRHGLGPFLGGVQILIINSGANTCQVFGNFFENSTIGGVPGSTGVALAVGSSISLVCGAAGVWIAIAGGAGGGLPITGGSLSGFLGETVATGQIGTGSTQAGAKLIGSQNTVASSCPTGTGFRLPALADVGVLGAIIFKNKDPSNNVLLYPPVGGQIDSFGVNTAVEVATFQSLTLVPDGVTTGQWWS